ncbi:TetR/AcrR family transcriptional regulator C-terminal domain-containing protein [Streptomyces sp. NBC_01264]|uniref:TetR/AcrR family transcriptional regulator C-terminal domain-containing protein n=1 Tax=Streptomyces sp. NBC_01264 TaxID=2903804 RepID=UPI00225C3246|nr:TetR/AcrR family transcriptional regulator C-terminal domain-containing protein [Streptomyces sp. NBC_01264]MCX4783622.1 TetR/AcrR family transcriptional regulator C-terminal domain-containing protein [Streptomyces sp. NBC_01264]
MTPSPETADGGPETDAKVEAEASEPGSPAWWQARYAARDRRRPRQGGLTLDRITAAALELADREGLEALTMRRLGEHLEVRHTSLYRHVASREELLIATVDQMLGEIRLPGPGGDWRAGLEDGAREFRRVLAAHPAVVPLLTTGQLLGPNALRAREHALAHLLAHGWAPQSAVQVYFTVTHFVIGAAVLDSGGAARTAGQRAAMADLFASLSPRTHPVVHQHAELLNSLDSEAEFEFGLRALLFGLGRLNSEEAPR